MIFNAVQKYIVLDQSVFFRSEVAVFKSIMLMGEYYEDSDGHLPFLARDGIAYIARCMLSPVRLSVTRTDQSTRSQAVAGIADRTAKNCSGYVT